MRELLDPWNDAARIAAMLGTGKRLIVLIGAESWCEKCRKLKPHFEAVARNASPDDLMLWFDLEEHQEFLGSYIPESLPELLMYRGRRLIARAVLPNGEFESLRNALNMGEMDVTGGEDPEISWRLMFADWAEPDGG